MRTTILKVFRQAATFLGLWILLAPLLQASEPSFIRESIRARGMGNAFTAAANDEMLLFYNPAALRSVNYNIYEAVGFNFTTNESTINLAKSSSSNATLGDLAGKKIYNEVNLGLLSHVNSRFGWSFFANGLLDLQIKNPVFPYLETKAYVQSGLAGGMAWSFLDYQLDVGLGAKIVRRAGIDKILHIVDEEVLEVIEKNRTTKFRKKYADCGGNFNSFSDSLEILTCGKAAFAPDAGVIYHFDSFHNMEPKVALSLQNIGGLDFKGAGKVPMTLNVGASSESELNGFDFIMAADYRDLTNAQKLVSKGSMLTQRNFKLGLEIGWNKLFNGHHLFSLRAGRNGPWNSIGWSMNIFGFKIDFAKYSQEIGGFSGALEDKRTSFQLSLIF